MVKSAGPSVGSPFELEGGSPAVLRQLNTRTILGAIRAYGPLSRSELRARTSLSRPTINEVLAGLFGRGWIVDEVGSDDAPGPGPRPRLVRFRSEMGYLVGVDTGAAKTLIVVSDLSCQPQATVRIDAHGVVGTQERLGHIVEGLKQALRAAGASANDVRAAVLSTPGVVDPATGVVTLAPQLGDWDGARAAATMAEFLRCPVTVENEMMLAVLGEHSEGGACGVDNVVYVGLGVGIGAGLIIDGRLHRGPRGTAGEIGYLPLVGGAQGDAAEAGLEPLEQSAGARAFIARGQAAARTSVGGLLMGLADGNPNHVDERLIFDAARLGDPEALRLVDELAQLLARAVATTALIVDPDIVVIGGGISGAGEILLGPLRRRVMSLLPFDGLSIIQSPLGERAPVVGAIRRAAQMADEQLLLTGATT